MPMRASELPQGGGVDVTAFSFALSAILIWDFMGEPPQGSFACLRGRNPQPLSPFPFLEWTFDAPGSWAFILYTMPSLVPLGKLNVYTLS